MEVNDLFSDVFDNLHNTKSLRWVVASPHQHHSAVPDKVATFLGERRKLYEEQMHARKSHLLPPLCSWWCHAYAREVCL